MKEALVVAVNNMGPFSKKDKQWLKEIVQQRIDDLEYTANEETGQDAADLINHAVELKILLKKLK